MSVRPSCVPYDRSLVEGLARARPRAGHVATEIEFAAGGAGFRVAALLGPGPLGTRIARTLSAGDLPYGAATRLERVAARPDGVDLVRLVALPRSALDAALAQAPGALLVTRDERHLLRLGANDSVFTHAPDGDARRWRALQREAGARLVSAGTSEDRIAAAGEITAMFTARALERGLAPPATLKANADAAIALMAAPSARVFTLVGSDGQVIAGTLGLVAGDTFFGLIGCGIDSGPLARRSPARLVKLLALEALQPEGVTAYDFGIGASPEKALLCNVSEPVVDVFLPLTLGGQVVGATMAASLAARRRLKEARLGEALKACRRALKRPEPARA